MNGAVTRLPMASPIHHVDHSDVKLPHGLRAGQTQRRHADRGAGYGAEAGREQEQRRHIMQSTHGGLEAYPSQQCCAQDGFQGIADRNAD